MTPDLSSGRAARIVLLGQMGAGKSSVGRALAARLGRPFRDNDDELMRRTGRDAAALAAGLGLDALHACEADALVALMQEPVPLVLSAAASVVDTLRRGDLPDDAFVVWLRASPAVLAERASGAGHRPRGLETEHWFTQTRQRDRHGAALADLVVDTDGRAVSEVVDSIAQALPRHPR